MFFQNIYKKLFKMGFCMIVWVVVSSIFYFHPYWGSLFSNGLFFKCLFPRLSWRMPSGRSSRSRTHASKSSSEMSALGIALSDAWGKVIQGGMETQGWYL